MKKLFPLLALAALLASCGRNTGPAVNLVSVHFQSATALETTATFTLRVSNEQPEPQTFSGSVHKIYLNGLYVGKGLCDAAITVPRLATVTNDVTVHLSNLALITRIKSVVEAKAIDCRIQSIFYGKSAFRRQTSETIGKLALADFMPNESATNAAPAEVPAETPVEIPATNPPPAAQ
jgi:LEA14-like dessication related protein